MNCFISNETDMSPDGDTTTNKSRLLRTYALPQSLPEFTIFNVTVREAVTQTVANAKKAGQALRFDPLS